MSIEGVWYNELNSMMELKRQGPSITGKYNTRVGDADGWYEVAGWVGGQESGRATLGLVVLWENQTRSTDSVTVWTGEWFIDPATGLERLEMMWLLTKETTAADEWTSTTVGKDFFYRHPASNPTRIKSTAAAHPQTAAG
jgi:hypothetical protein